MTRILTIIALLFATPAWAGEVLLILLGALPREHIVKA